MSEQLGLLSIDTGAAFSPFRSHRYSLRRVWDDRRSLVSFLMFNPSTADEAQDDPTLRKCRGFAERWSYGGMIIVNLFAIRGTDPRIVRKHADPVGEENNDYILKAARDSTRIVCAWGCGSHMKGKTAERPGEVLDLLRKEWPNRPINCLGYSQDGNPRHPLMLAYATPLEEFSWRGR